MSIARQDHEAGDQPRPRGDRGASSPRCASARAGAPTSPTLAGMFAGIEGMPRAQIEEQASRTPSSGSPTSRSTRSIAAQLELVEINLPNLK